METNESDDIKKLFQTFKSYYVVWKPAILVLGLIYVFFV